MPGIVLGPDAMQQLPPDGDPPDAAAMTTKAPPTEVDPTLPRTASEDPTTVRDDAPPRQAAPRPRAGQPEETAARPRVHLVVGPVGAGKSTYATALAARERALRLTLDDWMARLFRPDRPPTGVVPWYVERAARCVAQIQVVARAALALGANVVLEIGLLRREERAAFYAWADAHAPAADLVVHALDAPRGVRRARVERRNHDRGPTFSIEVPPAVFELASDLWEPLDDDERTSRDVRLVDTGDQDRDSSATRSSSRS